MIPKRGVLKMNKKKMILTSLASVAVLGATFVASQPSVVKADDKPTAAQPTGETKPTPAAETPKTEVEKAKEAEKEANAKVDEAQSKVDRTTTTATDAATKLETEKKEAAKADSKAKEEAAKEEAATKEEAEAKEALTEALKQIPDNELLDKKAKEELLKAVESGELNASDILAELADDAEKAQDTNSTIKTETPVSKDKLPEEVQGGIDEGEAADAARPASEKLQDKADDLTETIENLTDDAEKLKADAEKKAETLKRQEDTLKEAKEALKSAKDNGFAEDITAPLEKAVTAIEKERDTAKSEFDEAAEKVQDATAEIQDLTEKRDNLLEEVKKAEAKEAAEPAKPAEETPEEEAEPTEAEKAAKAKAEADAKVAELEKEVVAFLNSNEGGIIYIGIDKIGNIVGIENPDEEQLLLKDRFKHNILPSCMGLFDIVLERNEDKNILKIIVAGGYEKPYYVKKYGLSEKGVFIRVGSSAEPMPTRQIEQLFSKRTRNSIGKIKSPKQDLRFQQLQIYYQSIGKLLNEQFAKNLELLTEDNQYNYVAYLLNDVNGISVKVAKYDGLDRVDLIENNEYGYCSLMKATK